MKIVSPVDVARFDASYKVTGVHRCIATLAVIPMFLGYICFGYGLSKISASTATTLSLFEPAVATLFAVIIVGEQIPLIAWSGIGLIVVCLFILTTPGLEMNFLSGARKNAVSEQ